MQEELENILKELKKENENLQKSIERYKLIVEGSSDGLWDWNLTTDTVYLSKEWGKRLGFEQQEISGYNRKWEQLIYPKDRKRVLSNLDRCMKERNRLYQCEYRLKLKSGKYIWISSKGKLIFTEQGEPVRMSGSHTDITEKKRMEEKLENLAYQDQLTGTMLRTVFMDKLKAVVEEAKEGKLKPSVMFLDIDNFKTVNDIYGHNIGDLLLKRIAARLKSCIRASDLLGRIGGDEFAILVPDIKSIHEVDEIAQRIIDSFNYPIIISRYRLNTSTSIGIADYSDHIADGKTLLKRADIAMYKAKERGKNNLQHFTEGILEERVFRNDIRRDLTDAIDKNELYLLYQPLINAGTKQLVKLEALIRWRHSKNGIINPADFIPVAEETNLIIPIGEWVLKNALDQLRKWHELGYKDFLLSVNASIVQLQKPGFADTVSRILAETGISPEYIELEITESALIASMEPIVNNLRLLRRLGIRFSIDDYGTGYNSLIYIQKFEVDCIKIDKTFVNDIDENISNIIIKHLISLGHNINAEIVAEGVETKEQFEYLKEQGCDTIQGYYFSEPLLPEAAEEFLKHH